MTNQPGILNGKTALIFGVANDRSIAWGIAQALHAQGCELAFSYAGEVLEKRVRPLAAQVNARLVAPCDVTRDEDIDTVFAQVAETYGRLDYLVHAVAFAPREALDGEFAATTRAAFHTAMDISVYSLVALTRAAVPLMAPGSSIVTLSYYGAEKVMPRYNVMGVAKSALESSVRYLAADLGPRNIRVNAISAGPIKTLAAAGVAGFRDMLRYNGEVAPLRRNITIDEVGQAALFLLSDMASAITGEIMHVDAGYNVLGLTQPKELLDEVRQMRAQNA